MDWNLYNEELRDIILGKTTFRKCPCCDNNGRVYYDGNTGLGVGPCPPAGIAEEDIADDTCDDCHGLGFIQNFKG